MQLQLTESPIKGSNSTLAMLTLPKLGKRDLEALATFWSRYMKARRRYYVKLELNGDYGLWLALLETKKQLQRELGIVVHEIYEMRDDFWKYVDNLEPERMETEIRKLRAK